MALDDILAAIGGGLEGGLKGYSWSKEMEQKDRKFEQDDEVKRLVQSVKLQLASMAEEGRNQRYAEPSGNVVTQQAGATERTGMTVAGAKERAELGADTTRRGQDITEQLGITRDATTKRGQDFTFDLGVMRDDTARRGQDVTTRGQDVTSTTARRGQDMTSATAKAGQNVTFGLGTEANRLRAKETAPRALIEKNKLVNLWGPPSAAAPVEVKEPAVPVEQPEIVEKPLGALPVTPRSPEAGADEEARLTQQARSLISQFQKESDPAKKIALRSQLARVRAELLKAQAKSGGQ